MTDVAMGDSGPGILVQIIAANRLVRSGLRLLVESGAGLVVISELNRIPDARAVAPFSTPDVIVIDIEHESACTVDDFCARSRSSRVLVLAPDETAGRGRIAPLGASGILHTHRAEDLLVQAIRTVHHGGRWPAPAVSGSVPIR